MSYNQDDTTTQATSVYPDKAIIDSSGRRNGLPTTRRKRKAPGGLAVAAHMKYHKPTTRRRALKVMKVAPRIQKLSSFLK